MTDGQTEVHEQINNDSRIHSTGEFLSWSERRRVGIAECQRKIVAYTAKLKLLEIERLDSFTINFKSQTEATTKGVE